MIFLVLGGRTSFARKDIGDGIAVISASDDKQFYQEGRQGATVTEFLHIIC